MKRPALVGGGAFLFCLLEWGFYNGLAAAVPTVATPPHETPSAAGRGAKKIGFGEKLVFRRPSISLKNSYPANDEIMRTRFLTALPVYNEIGTVHAVLDQVLAYSPEVLVVDDGSTDGTSAALASRDDIRVVQHEKNQGYGAALRTAFAYAAEHDFEVLVTIDCDGQHEPQRIPGFVDACHGVDIVSGSRYLKRFAGDSTPPMARKRINEKITAEINRRLGFSLTDAFCGFKAYRLSSVAKLNLSENGYAMPLELWVQASCHRLKVIELPVPLIYLDEKRSFGGALDEPMMRLEYYHLVLDRSLALARAAAPAGSRCAEAVG